jgi:hypothetical protein
MARRPKCENYYLSPSHKGEALSGTNSQIGAFLCKRIQSANSQALNSLTELPETDWLFHVNLLLIHLAQKAKLHYANLLK